MKKTGKGAVVKSSPTDQIAFASQARKPHLLFKMVNLVQRQALSEFASETRSIEE